MATTNRKSHRHLLGKCSGRWRFDVHPGAEAKRHIGHGLFVAGDGWCYQWTSGHCWCHWGPLATEYAYVIKGYLQNSYGQQYGANVPRHLFGSWSIPIDIALVKIFETGFFFRFKNPWTLRLSGFPACVPWSQNPLWERQSWINQALSWSLEGSISSIR